MPISRSFNKEPLNGHRDIEVDSICLAVTTARLVEKINKNNFRFTIGEPMMKAYTLKEYYTRKNRQLKKQINHYIYDATRTN